MPKAKTKKKRNPNAGAKRFKAADPSQVDRKGNKDQFITRAGKVTSASSYDDESTS